MTKRISNLSISFFVTLAVLFCLVACNSQKASTDKENNVVSKKQTPKTTAKSSEQPQIAAKEAVFNFGKVKQGEVVEHIFKIQNTGKAPLKLERAKGS